jgi:CHAT domain-containing protein
MGEQLERVAQLMRDVQALLSQPAPSLPARAEAVDRAIAACEEALQSLAESDRGIRATVWYNLGVCWRTRLAGDPADNADRALACFQEALRLRDREAEPVPWATVQNALGVAWHERRRGDPGDNKRQALIALEQALAARRTLGDGDYTASTLANLANVRVRIGGSDRATHIEQAIAEYEEALELLDPDNDETRRAILFNLATTLLDRPGGDRADDVERAIAAAEESVHLATEPGEEHSAKLVLANALGLRLTGSKADDLERAIELVDDVIRYRTQHEPPERQASAHNSRGILYSRRIRGGRAENLDEAIRSYRLALEVYSPETHPAERAGALNNLATALRAHPFGNRERNEREAIAVLDEALAVYTRDDDPHSWAGTMSNLGTAHFERRSGDLNDNIDAAIAAYRAALEVRDEHDLPWEWAATQFNLGQALWRLQRGDRIANLLAAEEALTATLRVRARSTTPDEWAATQSMIAVVLDELAELDARPLDEAIEAYELALTVYRPETFPSEARANANNLAAALLRDRRPACALDVAQIGLRAAEVLYGAAATEEGRAQELDENARLYRIAVEAALDAHRTAADVFELSERGRGRLLGDWLAAEELPPPGGIAPELLAQEADALARLRDALAESRRADATDLSDAAGVGTTAVGADALRAAADQRTAAAARAVRARADLEDVWSAIASREAGAEYVEQRRGERLSTDALQRWLDDQPGRPAIVVFTALRQRPVALVAAAGMDGPRAIRCAATHSEVGEAVARLEREAFATARPAKRETWSDIGERVIAPALDAVDGAITLLYIVPFGGLHVVPWHAASVGGRPLIERFPIAYAPSASAAVRLARADRPALPREGSCAVFGDPRDDLKHARREAEEVGRRLGTAAVVGKRATRAAMRTALAGAEWAHLAAHGTYHADDPLSSGILAADAKLEARELIDARAPQTVIVSSCESGRQTARAGDELWGLGRALLYAGTRTAILAQWRVADRVTARLMLRFYEVLLEERDATQPQLAAALRRAMLDTREEDRRSFLWAPFTLTGNPY